MCETYLPLYPFFRIPISYRIGVLSRFSLNDLELLKMCETYLGAYIKFSFVLNFYI